jgi:GTP-binding protein YchF
VRGASRGEGLGNKFLSHIREVDAVVHVVRCFEDENIVHVDGSVNPARDVETISFELIFADMETVEKRLDRARKMLKAGDKKTIAEVALLERLQPTLESGKPARSLDLTEEEAELMRGFFLLTSKPIIYVANVSEDEIGGEPNNHVKALYEIAKSEKAEALTICCKLEEEIAELDPAEKGAFLAELGIKESGLDQLVKACYRLLGLISYLTAGPKEVRAWTIARGTKAPQAAGKIHTDFERGFIRAEIVPFTTLQELGSMTACKEKGLIRSEGKEYVMQDGDVTLFRINV